MLTKQKVFSKYKKTIYKRFSSIAFSQYKKIRTGMIKKIPLTEWESFAFENRELDKKMSAKMPLGFNYLTNSSEQGHITLEYIDLFDYIPKESLIMFIHSLKKFYSANSLPKFGRFHTADDFDKIKRMGGYYEGEAYHEIITIKLINNDFLKRNAPYVSIRLSNLSTSFLLVKFRFHIRVCF